MKLNYKCQKGTVDDSNKCPTNSNPYNKLSNTLAHDETLSNPNVS